MSQANLALDKNSIGIIRCKPYIINAMEQLRANDLVKFYQRREVVAGVSVEVNPGEIVGLLGPNGAGKTTIFYMIIGFVKPRSGQVWLGELDITRLATFRRANLGIGYLAQEPSIFRNLTVEQNIIAILEMKGYSGKRRADRLEELLSDLDITSVRKSKGYTLSGGERRRVEIARALVTRPKYMLLDEPFAGIDPIAVEDIQRIITDLTAQGMGVLITDHNVRETLSVCSRAYIMYDGKILKSGTSQELAGDAEVRKRYLGERFRL